MKPYSGTWFRDDSHDSIEEFVCALPLAYFRFSVHDRYEWSTRYQMDVLFGYLSYALVKYIVGEAENCSDSLFQCFSPRFAEDSSPKLERSEIRCEFVL